jgi:hypothetical protein
VLDGLDETVGGGLAVLTEEVGSLDRCQRAAGSKIPVGDVAVIEPYGDEPWHVGPAQPDLVDGQDEFFVLAALAARCAVLREAGDESQRVVVDGASDHCSPVLAGEQAGGVSPYGDPGGFELPLQVVYAGSVLADVGDEYVPGDYSIPCHGAKATGHAKLLTGAAGSASATWGFAPNLQPEAGAR